MPLIVSGHIFPCELSSQKPKILITATSFLIAKKKMTVFGCVITNW